MNSSLLTLALPMLCLATGCIPEHDYEGDYDMTYDVIMTSPAGAPIDALAGTTPVGVRHGLNNEYLLHLGASFCLLEGSYVEAETYKDWPYLEIAPQACWFTHAGKTFPMSLSGTATYTDGEDRLSIVLAGSYLDANGLPGSATVELTESW